MNTPTDPVLEKDDSPNNTPPPKSLHERSVLFYGLLTLLIILPYFGMVFLKGWYDGKMRAIDYAEFIVIDKGEMTLSLVDYKGDIIYKFGMACGKRYGDKTTIGDLKTPEGIFHVSSIEDASTWDHDFNDGKGVIPNAYGPWFIRLETPGHKGIGIHGTHAPESIGTRATEGCIRLRNEDLERLKEHAFVGMVVVVVPSLTDLAGTMMVDSLKKQVEQSDRAIEEVAEKRAQEKKEAKAQEKKEPEARTAFSETTMLPSNPPKK